MFFLVATSLLWSLGVLVPSLDTNVLSIGAYVTAAVMVWIGVDYFAAPAPSALPGSGDPGFLSGAVGLVIRPWRTIGSRHQEPGWALPIAVVGLNAVVGLVATVVLVGKIDFSRYAAATIRLSDVILVGGVLNVLAAQVGGWIVQSFLIFCLLVLMDGQRSMAWALRTVGMAYVGFLMASVVMLMADALLIPHGTDLSGLSEWARHWPVLIGKTAELWVLALICYGVRAGELFSVGRSFVVGITPSAILLGTKLAVTALLR